MSSRSTLRADPADHFIGRWLKSGLAGKVPPANGRGRLLAAAAASEADVPRVWPSTVRGRPAAGMAVPPDDWSCGLARQAVLRWFPALTISYRLGY
jgi:hypothetical protein